jgi:hypothetical protein
MTSIADLREFMEERGRQASPAKAQELAKSLMAGQGKGQVTRPRTICSSGRIGTGSASAMPSARVKSPVHDGCGQQDELGGSKRVRELERARRQADHGEAIRRSAPRRSRSLGTPAAPVVDAT